MVPPTIGGTRFEVRGQMSSSRGSQRTYPVVSGCRLKRYVWALWTSADGGGAEGGELRTTIESDGSRVADLHLWRFGPGHLGAIVSVCPKEPCTTDYYRAKLARYPALSHVTIEIQG
jgi:hypothetical protein